VKTLKYSITTAQRSLLDQAQNLRSGTARSRRVPCAKSVPESDVFMPFDLALSEKQIPPYYVKHREAKIGNGAVGVGRSAPKAGAPGGLRLSSMHRNTWFDTRGIAANRPSHFYALPGPSGEPFDTSADRGPFGQPFKRCPITPLQ
jgi:hypothetical protein